MWRALLAPFRAGPGQEGVVDLVDVPLDDPPAFEGDDSIHAPSRAEGGAPRAGPAATVIPLPRTLKQHMRGRDVLAVQRALATNGYRRWGAFTLVYGPGTVAQVKSFQQDVGLLDDGEYGRDTHREMVRRKGFDRYGAKLMASAAPPPADGARGRIVQAAMFCHARRESIHYTQGAMRMQGVRERRRLPRFPVWEDCSSFATWLYWQAGADDPNAAGYNGFGFTGTQVSNPKGRSIPPDQARPGDLVFYGGTPATPSHVAVYVGDRRVVSHGSEPGPHLLAVDYRPIGHVRSYL